MQYSITVQISNSELSHSNIIFQSATFQLIITQAKYIFHSLYGGVYKVNEVSKFQIFN